ncbi:aldehyde dehydrogenase family protein, partial [Mesorhizobium sp. M2D.F.Ca.ET.233.01.1.1]
MNEVSMLIAGKDCPASNGATFERINPDTGAVASRAPAATLADADAAVQAAAAAFPAWSALRPSERRARLLKAADIMDARAGAFIECGMAE